VVNIIGPQLQQYNDLDALFMIDDLDVSGRMLTLLRKAGVKMPIIGTDSLDFPGIWREAGAAAEHTCFVSLRAIGQNNTQVDELYRTVVAQSDRDHVSIDDFTHCGFLDGYDTMSLYLSAVEEAGSFYPRELGIVLRNQTWETLHGRVRFSSDGDVIGRKLLINEIVNGHPKTVFAEESE
jgi:ABC-type branched-subunit amino acid transport system substrate-binding protein